MFKSCLIYCLCLLSAGYGYAQNMLNAPTGLTVEPASSSHFMISWKDNSDNETGFVLEGKSEKRNYWVKIGTIDKDVTSYEAGGCFANETYSFRIRALLGSSYSEFSEIRSGKTAAFFDGQQSRVIESSTDRQGEGTFLKAGNGELQIYFGSFTGVGDKDPSRIARKVSKDDGKTWSAKELLFAEEGNSLLHPSIVRFSKNRIGIAYSKMVLNTWRAYKVFRYSTDDGKTWSEEIKVSDDRYEYTTGAHDRFVTLSNGMVVNVAHSVMRFKSDSLKGKMLGTDLYATRDGGLTWFRLNQQTVTNNENPYGTGEYGFYEASLVEYETGKLALFGRNATKFLLCSYSNDFGVTWTEPCASSIQQPLAPVRIQMIPGTKKMLLIHNPNLNSRFLLASRVSEDGGKSWQHYRQLEYDNIHYYAYPAILIDKETVYLAHWKTTLENNKWKKVEVAFRSLPLSFF